MRGNRTFLYFHYPLFEGERKLLFRRGSHTVGLLKLRPHGSDLLLQEQEKHPQKQEQVDTEKTFPVNSRR